MFLCSYGIIFFSPKWILNLSKSMIMQQNMTRRYILQQLIFLDCDALWLEPKIERIQLSLLLSALALL